MGEEQGSDATAVVDLDDLDDDALEAMRPRLAIALDVDDRVEAIRLARAVAPFFGVAKVGLELYSAAGPRMLAELADSGMQVFVDLKLHDIPTTVERAARVLGSLGVRYVTLHTQGGRAMLAAGVEGLASGAASAEIDEPIALGVTVLTSDVDVSPRTLIDRVALAAEAGCGGVVCAGPDLEVVRELAPRLLKVTPGIRPAGSAADDQARVMDPASALAAGADLLVIGRPVTRAPDPELAAAEIAAALVSAATS
jgi:orotidine-5'-phosphate decarboxylase